MRSFALFNLTGDDRLKPIVHKLPPKNNRATHPRKVLVTPTIEDVKNFQKMQELLRPLTIDGSYPTWAGVVRAALKVVLLIEEVDPGALLKLLDGERLPKSQETSLPHPEAITAIETESEVLAQAAEANE
jgi:hypothetical protein